MKIVVAKNFTEAQKKNQEGKYSMIISKKLKTLEEGNKNEKSSQKQKVSRNTYETEEKVRSIKNKKTPPNQKKVKKNQKKGSMCLKREQQQRKKLPAVEYSTHLCK